MQGNMYSCLSQPQNPTKNKIYNLAYTAFKLELCTVASQ